MPVRASIEGENSPIITVNQGNFNFRIFDRLSPFPARMEGGAVGRALPVIIVEESNRLSGGFKGRYVWDGADRGGQIEIDTLPNRLQLLAEELDLLYVRERRESMYFRQPQAPRPLEPRTVKIESFQNPVFYEEGINLGERNGSISRRSAPFPPQQHVLTAYRDSAFQIAVVEGEKKVLVAECKDAVGGLEVELPELSFVDTFNNEEEYKIAPRLRLQVAKNGQMALDWQGEKEWGTLVFNDDQLRAQEKMTGYLVTGVFEPGRYIDRSGAKEQPIRDDKTSVSISLRKGDIPGSVFRVDLLGRELNKYYQEP